ncbi:MAG: zinc-ribbon domain-containing protein [Methanomassiliicoccales archaeon]|nr:zinc-ribbon domain-containing protein [Methanomassiliicoccales archaeon]
MDLYLLTVIAWLLVGVVCAAIVYLDMRKLKRVDALWIVVVFLLPIIGLIVYVLLIRGKGVPYEYPPKANYPAPEYKFEKQAAPQQKEAPKEEKKVEQIEGIPRCPHCGAAISTYDEKCPKCGKELRPS